jgi:hypothetical protein
MKWELFQEHMRRDSIWKLLSEWKNAVAAYLQASHMLNEKVVNVLREKTGLDLIETLDKAGSKYLYPAGANFIHEYIVNSELRISPGINFEKELKTEEPHLNYGRERIPILTAPGEVDKYKTEVLTAVGELRKSVVTNQIITSYRIVEDITYKASRAIEELSLLRLVPGQCRVCRRLC